MKGFKKKKLEMKLEEIPPHPEPSPDLEQYTTPAEIAADLLFTAYAAEDIYGKKLIDLGCGTGIFSLGAALLGAEKVIGVDVDREAIKVAEDTAESWGVADRASFKKLDVTEFSGKGDVVLMNPPFGAQKRGADLPFLRKAFSIAPSIYTIHNSKTEDFLLEYIQKNNYRVKGQKKYMFELDNIFEFHQKSKEEIKVTLFILEEKR